MTPSTILADLLTALNPACVALTVLGCLIGLIVGSLPGLTTTMGIALLAGITYKLSGLYAIALLLGLYVGGVSGGALSAILVGIPGTPASAATALDGFPLAMQGKAARAILVARSASIVGTLFGVVCLLFLTPMLSALSIQFTSAEFFLIGLFGILISGSLSGSDLAVKGWLAGLLGISIGMVGADELVGYQCLTFGNTRVFGGIPFVPVMIGFFGLPQVIESLGSRRQWVVTKIEKATFPLRELLRHTAGALRSGLIGTGIGLIPGVGEDVASWVSYGVAKRLSKHPEEFGKGSLEGMVAAESANHACIGGALIPLLSLGIPGSPPAAVLLGALLIHGIRPGPMLQFEQPAFLYQCIAWLCVAMLAMGVIILLVARPISRILQVRPAYSMPIIVVLCAIGAWSLDVQMLDLVLLFASGILGLLFRAGRIPSPPLILGIILGPLVNSSFRRALQSTHGDFSIFVTRPISLVLVIAIVLLVATQSGLWELVRAGMHRSGRPR